MVVQKTKNWVRLNSFLYIIPFLKMKDQTKAQSRSKRNEAKVFFLGGVGESVGFFNGFRRR